MHVYDIASWQILWRQSWPFSFLFCQFGASPQKQSVREHTGLHWSASCIDIVSHGEQLKLPRLMTKAPRRLLSLLDYAAATLSGPSRKAYAQNLQHNCDTSCSSGAPGVRRPAGASLHSSASAYSRRLPNRRTSPQHAESVGVQSPSRSHKSHVRTEQSQEVSVGAHPAPLDIGEGRCSAITRRHRRVNASRDHIKGLLSRLQEHERQEHGAEALLNQLRSADPKSSMVGSPPLRPPPHDASPLRASSDATHKHNAPRSQNRSVQDTAFQQSPRGKAAPAQSSTSSCNRIFGDLFTGRGSKADDVAAARPGRLRRVLHSLGTGDMLEAMVTVSEVVSSAMELLPVVWNAFRGRSTPQSPHDDTSSTQPAFKFAKSNPNKPVSVVQSKPASTVGKARNVGKQGRADALRAKRNREISWATKAVENATGKGRTRPGASRLSAGPSNELPAAAATEETISAIADAASTSLPQDALWPVSSRGDVPGWLSGWPVPGIHGPSAYEPNWADLVPTSSTTSGGSLSVAPAGRDSQGGASLFSAEDGSESLPPTLSQQHVLPDAAQFPPHGASGGHLQEWQQIMAHSVDTKPKPNSWHRLADDLSLPSTLMPSLAASLADRVSLMVTVCPWHITPLL